MTFLDNKITLTLDMTVRDLVSISDSIYKDFYPQELLDRIEDAVRAKTTFLFWSKPEGDVYHVSSQNDAGAYSVRCGMKVFNDFHTEYIPSETRPIDGRECIRCNHSQMLIIEKELGLDRG